MNSDESGVITLPRPAPLCWASDKFIPSFAELGAWVLSIIWAEAEATAEARKSPTMAGVCPHALLKGSLAGWKNEAPVVCISSSPFEGLLGGQLTWFTVIFAYPRIFVPHSSHPSQVPNWKSTSPATHRDNGTAWWCQN